MNPLMNHWVRFRLLSGLLGNCLYIYLAFTNYMLPDLAAQKLSDETMGYLLGKPIYPQDNILGLLYIPEGTSKASQKIFELVRSFWNQVNAGNLDPILLSENGKTQISEQLARFTKSSPYLYRESLKEPAEQFPPLVPALLENLENLENQDTTANQTQDLPPIDSLRLSLVRLARPVIEEDYARVRCRLELNNYSGFNQVDMYFLQEEETWKIDALDVDWDRIDVKTENTIEVFGRKQEQY